MKRQNLKSNGKPRLGRPTGPTSNRGSRPWDSFDKFAICVVAANPDLERWKIAVYLGMTLSKLSTITCSPRGVVTLDRLSKLDPEDLSNFKI